MLFAGFRAAPMRTLPPPGSCIVSTISKRLLKGSNSLPALLQEIRFLNLLFTKHPKCGDGWAHRHWVVTAALERMADEPEAKRDALVGGELRVCARVAETYPKCYYAWTHRQRMCQAASTRVVSAGCWARRALDLPDAQYCVVSEPGGC